MKIANPLYDHAFKYLMSNNKLARKVLPVIEELRPKLGAEEEVEAIFAQQEAEKAYYKRTAEEERRQKEEALEQAREARIKLARLLLRTGPSVKDVAEETGVSEEEVRKSG